jgi:hypothetical protein
LISRMSGLRKGTPWKMFVMYRPFDSLFRMLESVL